MCTIKLYIHYFHLYIYIYYYILYYIIYKYTFAIRNIVQAGSPPIAAPPPFVPPQGKMVWATKWVPWKVTQVDLNQGDLHKVRSGSRRVIQHPQKTQQKWFPVVSCVDVVFQICWYNLPRYFNFLGFVNRLLRFFRGNIPLSLCEWRCITISPMRMRLPWVVGWGRPSRSQSHKFDGLFVVVIVFPVRAPPMFRHMNLSIVSGIGELNPPKRVWIAELDEVNIYCTIFTGLPPYSMTKRFL